MSVRLGMVVQATSAKNGKAAKLEGKSLKLSFDENDDLVIEDVPDDLLATVAKLASERAISEEDMWRELIVQLYSKDAAT